MATGTSACLRWLIRRDMPYVLAIEGESFKYPWTEAEIIERVKDTNNVGMVAEINEDVVGYMIFQMRKREIELLVLAVHPKYLRSGIGGALIRLLISKLAHERRQRIVVKVRESNLVSQLFFRSMGFLCTEVLHDYYDDSDAYVMEYFVR